jgi:hypothetical protein
MRQIVHGYAWGTSHRHMFGGGSVGELAKETWDEIRQALADGASFNHLEKRYGVTRQNISRKARKLGWIKGDRDEIEREAHAKADGIRAGQSLDEIMEAIDRASDERAEIIKTHRRQWAALDMIRDTAMRLVLEAMSVNGVNREALIQEANTITNIYIKHANVALNAQEGQRRAYGFDYKIQQKEEDRGNANAQYAEQRRQLIAQMEEANRRAREEYIKG